MLMHAGEHFGVIIVRSAKNKAFSAFLFARIEI